MAEQLSIDRSHAGASHLAITVDERVARIELRRPEVLNALHSDTHRALQAALDLVEERDDVGAVILAGAGRAFCTGSDLREVGALRGVDSRRYVELDFATKNRVEASPLPVVAAIQGWCVGGGVELALACDIRIAADDAIFSMREVPLGSLPGSGGLQRLPLVVGLGVAKDWILRGIDVPAEEAYRRGLVTELVRPEELGEAAQRIAGALASQSATALRLAKVAMSPEPFADHGLVAAFQALAVSACHDDPSYHQRTERYTAKRPT
jgi:enoyl-CoA hydratase/carnithine racemase